MRTYIYARHSFGENGTEPELLHQSVEDRGDAVVGTFRDDPAILSKGKNAGWNAMLGDLDNVEQVVVGSVADLPGRKVPDLLAILSILRDHGVSLRVHREGIDTDAGPTAMLDLIAGYRRAKLSQAIKIGQKRARTLGKVIGRPSVPEHIRRGIQIAVAGGGGIRPTARLFGLSPASVVNIRRMMDVEPEKLAA